MMRMFADFSWNYFRMSGDVDAYMLYKDMGARYDDGDYEELAADDEEQLKDPFLD